MQESHDADLAGLAALKAAHEKLRHEIARVVVGQADVIDQLMMAIFARGHCILEDGVILSGNSAVHQFVRIGRLGLISGCSATSKDIPPFVIQQGLNGVAGINLVGMKRAGMPRDQISAVRGAFKILFREGLALPAAMAKLERELGQNDAIQEMLTFLRGCTNGINFMRHRFHEDLAA
mgnify:CR=1 FL=1